MHRLQTTILFRIFILCFFAASAASAISCPWRGPRERCRVRQTTECDPIQNGNGGEKYEETCQILFDVVCDDKGPEHRLPLLPLHLHHHRRHKRSPSPVHNLHSAGLFPINLIPLGKPACRQVPRRACQKLPGRRVSTTCRSVPRRECEPIPNPCEGKGKRRKMGKDGHVRKYKYKALARPNRSLRSFGFTFKNLEHFFA